MLALAHRWMPPLLALLPQLALAEPLPGDDLYAVSTPDGARVVAVGAFGAIRVSADGGESWRNSPAPVESTLTSVSMADAVHGWGVGMHGVVLRTADGGASWTRQSLPPDSEAPHLLGVHALDSQRALAVGAWGARLHTEDGGQSWRDAPLTIGPDHPRFSWLDPAERARVRRGGSVREDVALQSVACRPGGEHCALAGEFGTLLISRDAGRSWSAAEIEIEGMSATSVPVEGGAELAAPAELASLASGLSLEPTASLEVEAFVSQQEIERLVRDGEPAALFELVEARLEAGRAAAQAAGAPTDRLRSAGRPPWELAGFGGADPAALERYLAARRAPRPGLRWRLRLRPLLYDVVLTETGGWAVGLGGVVLVSEDGGHRWRRAPAAADGALYAAAASGDGRVWIAGERGSLWSPAGGLAPEPGAPPGRFLRDLAFAPAAPAIGFAVGEGGLILRTRDGGAHWTRVAP